MSKKHFIALADHIKRHPLLFPPETILSLADFLVTQNYNFNRERWTGYVAGKCGPSGGKVKGGAQ